MNITIDPQSKQRRTDTNFDSDSGNERKTRTQNWPHFLLVQSGDKALPIAKPSPLAIDKGSQALIQGRLRSIMRLRNGAFLMECETEKQSDLFKSPKLADGAMKVSMRPNLNFSRGVIRCCDLAGMAETDIRDELADQGVTSVKRVRIKDQGKERKQTLCF